MIDTKQIPKNVIDAADEHELFSKLVNQYRYDFRRLVYIVFPFGEKGHELEHKAPRQWQMEEWDKISKWLANPLTRYELYRLVISTGNGSGKTAFGAMTMIMLLYTQKLRGRVTANTKPQLTQIVWPEYDKWFKYARYSDTWFEKLGESIKSRDEIYKDQWQFSMFTWDENNPSAVSGLHNEGHAVLYTFEEAAGIPGKIFEYARGAFSDANTIKIQLLFGNSDDPYSQFEKYMQDPEWNRRRIDTRTLENVDKKFIEMVLKDCGGDEDADDFRVRVRGLPRKTNADSIININKVREALNRRHDFDISKVNGFPSILTVDPAWTGGDLTTIWWHQGHYSKLLAAFRLNSELGDDHNVTYQHLCRLEKDLRVDAVFIDQGEGTALKTLANRDGKYHWELISFANKPNDEIDPKDSEFANIRSQMYYAARAEFNEGSIVLDFADDIEIPNTDKSVEELIMHHFGMTKGDRHKTNLKKLCQSKKDIKAEYNESPDLCDGYILKHARSQVYKREEHLTDFDRMGDGAGAYDLPESVPDYSMASYKGVSYE